MRKNLGDLRCAVGLLSGRVLSLGFGLLVGIIDFPIWFIGVCWWCVNFRVDCFLSW